MSSPPSAPPSVPPSGPPQSTLCARCGRRYPAGSEHACETTERDAALPAATPAPAPPGAPTETVNLGLAPTLASSTGPESLAAELSLLATRTSQSVTQTAAVDLSTSGLNPVHNPHDPLIGQVINERFKVLRRIGKGGMGAVYKARHLALDTNVAIKVLLHQRSHDDQERFIQEAKLASKVRHPNTVYISDFGFLADGRLYLVMELLAGRILSSEISTGPLELTRALQIAIQITRGLQAVHDKGIVHRDMKPENVFLLDQDGTHDFVKIVDFGIAKATNAASLTEDASSPLNVNDLEKALLAEETAKSGAWAKTETRAGQTIEDLRGRLDVRIAGHDIGDEAGAVFLLQRRELCADALDAETHIVTPSASATVKMSLSPRPHRFISTMPSLPTSFAISPMRAKACDGSSAGMMPSNFEHSWKASSASASVVER